MLMRHGTQEKACSYTAQAPEFPPYLDVIFPTSASVRLFPDFCLESNISLSPFKCCLLQGTSCLLISILEVPKSQDGSMLNLHLSCKRSGFFPGQCTRPSLGLWCSLLISILGDGKNSECPLMLPPQTSLLMLLLLFFIVKNIHQYLKS